MAGLLHDFAATMATSTSGLAESPQGDRSKRAPGMDVMLVAFTVLALLASITASVKLWRYKETAGVAATAMNTWPRQSQLRPSSAMPTLLLFAHPQCSCTAASLTNLRELMSHFAGKVDARVVFSLPEGVDESWRHTANWAAARDIPGVSVVTDVDRRESRIFGSETSGQVMLYAATGALLYSGGITGARGHVGENPGLTTVENLLAGANSVAGVHPVFGCSLEEPR
jgi:hypothetical protein